MSSSEDKNPKKGKRSFIPKLPSFRRKKNNPSPDDTSKSKSKKQRNENSSNTKISIAKETQTPKASPPLYRDKSTSQVVDTYNRCLAELKEEEEQNGNNQSRIRTALSNINTTSVFTTSTTTTCFINPEYEGDIWRLQNQNTKKGTGGDGEVQEINANVNQKRAESPTHIIPLSPVKTNSYQHIGRCSSVTSTLSSGSSLSLSSPGSLSKLIGGPKPYKSVFTDEPRGVKRQGSTPSDLDITSSCVSVSGSVSSLSPTIDDVATKVTVKSCSVPGLHQYPIVAPVESLSPGVSPKHSHSKREGAYTYDSSGCESEGSTKEKTLTRGSYDISSAAEKTSKDAAVPHTLVNLNFDLQAAAAASPQINANLRRERQRVLAGKAKSAVGEPSQNTVTKRQESPSSAAARREEELISPRSAASASSGPTNNNPASESRHEALIQPAQPHVGSDSCSGLAQRQQSAISTPRTSAALHTPQHSTPCSQINNAGQTAGQDQEKSDEVVLTRVRSVTSPIPLKTSRALYALSHIQLSAMRNKLRSESFDSSDLDSLASDDLMCEADNTFLDPSEESHLTQGNGMPGEQGFSPYPNSAKGKRLRNNSIEFLVASFDKR
nr:uncharacterized protein LOC129281955 [Lytechinus pictus]